MKRGKLENSERQSVLLRSHLVSRFILARIFSAILSVTRGETSSPRSTNHERKNNFDVSQKYFPSFSPFFFFHSTTYENSFFKNSFRFCHGFRSKSIKRNLIQNVRSSTLFPPVHKLNKSRLLSLNAPPKFKSIRDEIEEIFDRKFFASDISSMAQRNGRLNYAFRYRGNVAITICQLGFRLGIARRTYRQII